MNVWIKWEKKSLKLNCMKEMLENHFIPDMKDENVVL